MLLLSDTVSAALDDNKRCLGVFLDLAKAFDTVSIPILLQKLSCLGVRGIPHDWFRSYLTNRSQCVRVGKDISDQLPIEFGVPQGSVLGPTLFLIYMCDIMNIPIDCADIICYADDTVIIFKGISWEEVHKTAEKGMSLIADWLNNNLLTLNIGKTKYLAFHISKASEPPLSLSLKLHNCTQTTYTNPTCHCHSIARTDHMKYL